MTGFKIFSVLIFSSVLLAQPPQRLIFVTSDPAGACTSGQPLQWNSSSGNLWGCNAGTWTKLNGGGGSSITLETNGTNNSSQSVLNIQNGTNTTASNPSTGNVQVSVPTATSSTLGVVEPDNSTITISGGIISSVASGGTVTSITLNGTAGQITLTGGGSCTSTTVVVCTFSLPSNVVLPGTINSLTLTTSTGTLTIANGKTLTDNNSVIFSGTDGSTLSFGAGGTIFYTSTTLGCTQMPVLTGDVSNTNCALTVSNGSHITNSSIPNSGLVNTGTVVNSTTCTLGSSCTITASPSGSAGGSLAGTYPNPTIASSVSLPGNPTTTTQTTTDNSTKIATTAYVTTAITNAIAGVNPAIAVQAATTAASDTSSLIYNNGVSGIGATLTGSNNIALTIDGFTFTAVNQRLLVKNDTQSPSGAFNGVYFLSQLQALALPPILTRALDYDTPSDINNTGAIPVVNGTINGTTTWVLTSSVTTVGTDPLTYTKFSSNPSTLVTSVTGTSPISSSGGQTPAISCSTCVTGVTGTTPISSSGGTTPAISVATATSSAKGVVQTDGSTISNSSGTISCTTSTTSQLGCVKPDGTSITISAGVISASSAITVAQGVIASLPTCNSTLNEIYYPTDSVFQQANCLTGASSWTYLIGGQSVVPPTAANTWTTVNGGSGTGSLTNGGGVVIFSSTSSVLAIEGSFKSTPSAPYTKILAFRFNTTSNASSTSPTIAKCGVAWTNGTSTSSSIQMFTLGYYISPSGTAAPFLILDIAHYTSFNLAGGTDDKLLYPILTLPSGLLWVKLADDNTNRTFSFSNDGVSYQTYLSTARGTPFTPTNYGVMCASQGSGSGSPYSLTLVNDN